MDLFLNKGYNLLKKNVSIIIVAKNPFIFTELALAIQDALLLINYSSKIYNYNNYKISDINIFVHGLRHKPDPKYTNICIQTENKYRSDLAKIDKNWDLVLDFFPEQCHNSNARYFQMGYSKWFGAKYLVKEIRDLFFFGYLPPRRKEINQKNKIMYIPNLFGWSRDIEILASSINVNLKPDNGKYFFSPLRFLLVACKGKFFLQEEVNGGYGVYKPYLKFFNERNFRNNKNKWLRKNALREEFSFYVCEELKANHKFEDSFLNCVKGLL